MGNSLKVVDVQILGQALGLLIEKSVLVLCEEARYGGKRP